MEPIVSDELLDLVRRTFPVRIGLETSKKDLHIMVGRQQVLRFLEQCRHQDETEEG
jgi:hypothetical protein